MAMSNTGYKKDMQGQNMPQQLNVKYMDPRVVNRNRQSQLMLRQKFLLRQALMKKCGEKEELMGKIEVWIEDDIDEIYKLFTSTRPKSAAATQKMRHQSQRNMI